MRLHELGTFVILVLLGVGYFSGAIDHNGSTLKPEVKLQTNITPAKLKTGIADYANFN